MLHIRDVLLSEFGLKKKFVWVENFVEGAFK